MIAIGTFDRPESITIMYNATYFVKTPLTRSSKLKGIVPVLFSNTFRQYVWMNALGRNCRKIFLELRECLHALELLPAILQTVFMRMIQTLGIIG